MPNGSSNLDPTIVVALIGIVSAVVSFFVRGFLEKQRTNKAVLAEIRRLLVVIKRHNHWYRHLEPEKRPNFPLIPFSYVVYKKQVENVGVLKRGLVAKAVQFYGFVDFLNSLQATRAEHKHQADFDKLYLDSLAGCESTFFHDFDTDLKNARIALPE